MVFDIPEPLTKVGSKLEPLEIIEPPDETVYQLSEPIVEYVTVIRI